MQKGPYREWTILYVSAKPAKTQFLLDMLSPPPLRSRHLELETRKLCKTHLFLQNFFIGKKFSAWNAFLHPFLRLKGAIGSVFQAFSAEKSKNFGFLTKIQMTQNGNQMHQIALKTPFSSSRRLVGMIQYLGGASATHIGVCMAPWKRVDDATFGSKIGFIAKHAIFQL